MQIAPNSGHIAAKPTLLAVDDTEDNLFIIEAFLSDDFDVHTASNGDEALALFPTLRPAVVLLDVMMPGIDGLEVCRQIRAFDFAKATKVLMVSAKNQLEDRLAGYEAGADDYVAKPFDEQELIAKVNVYLKLKHAEEVQTLVRSALDIMSHQLRTPLNGILAPLEMLTDAESAMSPEEVREWAGIAYASSTRLSTTIEKVLTLASLRAEDYEFSPERVGLSHLIEQCATSVRSRPGQGNAELRLNADASIETQGEPALLTIAVQGILDNAFRHSPAGETVDITALATGGDIVVTFRDHGPGIAPGHLEKVFDSFTTEAAHHHSTGDGLSMSLAKEIAALHGGSLAASNAETGSGAVFTLTLPAHLRGDA